MEEALKFAIILTNKHQAYNDLLMQSNHFSSQKIIRQKQTEISHQVIEFLNELQDVKHIVLKNDSLKSQYLFLLTYYSKHIYIKIEQFQQKLNLLNFEKKFTHSIYSTNNFNIKSDTIESIQQKMNSYYNLIIK